MNALSKKEEASEELDENVTKQILEENTKLSSLPPQVIMEVASVFRLLDSQANDPAELLKKIRSKLANIINEEKQECVNYLQLPKFQNLSTPTKQSLKDILVEVWEEVQKRMASKESIGKISKYLCQSSNPKQVEEFHLRLFQSIKSYFYYYPQYMNSNSNFQMMGGSSQQPQNTQNGDHFGMYQQMGMQNMPNMNQMPGFQNIPFQNNHFYPGNYNNVKMEEVAHNSSNPREDTFSQQNQAKEQYPQPKKMYSVRNRTSNGDDTPTYSKNRLQKQIPQAANKIFWKCACQGRIPPEQRHFQCYECKKKFHLSCLLIPQHAAERPGVHKICPQCSLRNNNAFYEVIGDPLQTFWSDDKQLHKQKITIKGKKCKQIIEKKYSLQLRFLKVEGRSIFSWDDATMVKQQGGMENKIKKNYLNEILIKEQMLTRGNGEDVKISLDCMRQNGREDLPVKKSVMIFVAINVLKKKTLPEIIEAHYDDTPDDYLDRFFKDLTEEVKIEVLDSTPKLITIPVRGIECDHPDVFDLEQFVNHSLGLNTDTCFYCGKKCQTFKIDRKIQQALKRIREEIPEEHKHPSAIFYQRDGTFKWNEAEMMDEEGEQSEMKENNLPEFHIGEGDMELDIDMDMSDDNMDDEDSDSDSEEQNSRSKKVSGSKKIRKNTEKQ